ncbi:sulfate/molybdate ABC transporter ATP-binding protein [Syntrophomonas curvata]
MLDIAIRKTLPEFKLDVAFRVDQEIMAILGPSGCGKTMTLKCIAGLMLPDQGSIKLNQRVLFDSERGINLPARERKIGFLFQNYALFPHLTVFDNIAFGIRHLPASERRARVEQLLPRMRLELLAHRYPSELSGGQQQRVALARALAAEPEVLLLDEPFSALDTIVKQRLEEELLEIQDYYRGHVLFVTHNLAEAYRLSSKMAVYEAGAILQWGNRQSVIECPASRKVARLTGMENIFNARISQIQGNRVQLTIAGGDVTVYPKDPGKIKLNQTVSAAIRPEYVRLAADEGENCLSARLIDCKEELSFFSYRFDLELTEEPVIIKAWVPKTAGPPITPGKAYRLYLPAEKLVLIPEGKY